MHFGEFVQIFTANIITEKYVPIEMIACNEYNYNSITRTVALRM